MITNIILPAIFGPFLLWPIEVLFPYPHIIEELFKVFIVFKFKTNLKTAVLSGVLFALTETVFYIVNINYYGDLNLLFTRFIITSILHSLTMSIIYLSNKKRFGIIIGFILTVTIHYFYNIIVYQG